MPNWSHYQQAIFSAIRNTSDSLIVEAVAGSGKTTTLEECGAIVYDLNPKLRVVYCAFSKDVVVALNARFRKRGLPAMAKSIHSIGWATWREHLAWDAGDCKVDQHKTQAILDDEAVFTKRERWGIGGQTARLVGYAKQHGIVPSYSAQDPANSEYFALIDDVEDTWNGLIEHYGLIREECNVDAARKILRESLRRSRAVVDYDDMLWLPVVGGVGFQRYDVVFVDEAQDVSGIQMEMIARIVNGTGRVVAVGDTHQCQPAGTMVLMAGGNEKPIEELQDGDRVVSYKASERGFYLRGRPIQVSSREYTGMVTTIKMGSKSSSYTSNHRCYADFSPLREKFVVYMMRRGVQYRIGLCKMNYNNIGAGPVCRMQAEDADAVWILEAFDSWHEARVYEASLSGKWGIPQLTFKQPNGAHVSGNTLTNEMLDRIWGQIGDNSQKAGILLGTLNRDPRYPLFRKGCRDWKSSLKRPGLVYACNLMTGVLMLPIRQGMCWNSVAGRKSDWTSVTVEYDYIKNARVYSLNVEDDHMYVADGIVTHNSIYGFRGAMSNSMQLLAERFGCKPLPLSISYRCPKSVVLHAQQWVPHLEYAEGAADGVVLGPMANAKDWDGQAAMALGASLNEPSIEALALGVPKTELCLCTHTFARHVEHMIHDDFYLGHCQAEHCGCLSYVAAKGGSDESTVMVEEVVAESPSGKDRSRGIGVMAGTGETYGKGHPGGPVPCNDGITKWLPYYESFAPGDAILCRVNRPLAALAFRLIRARVPCKLLGRDIGVNLIALIKKLMKNVQRDADTISELSERMEVYRQREGKRLIAKRDDAGLAALYDKLDTVLVFLEEANSVAEVIREIEGMFGEDAGGGVVLCTVHKAKGLEWDRVFVLDAEEFMPGPWARQDWEREQEVNLQYVAATRAKRELRYIKSGELQRRSDG